MSFRRLSLNEVLSGGSHWITVTRGLVAYFPVEMWMNNRDYPREASFPEPWDKPGFYRQTEFQAACDAYEIAKEMRLPFFLPNWSDEELETRKEKGDAER